MARNDKDILAGIAGSRLAVIGDSMVDVFHWGRVDRISPEAPVPVVRLERTTTKLGGAANVAANVRALGAEAFLFSLCGDDEDAGRLKRRLADDGIDPAGLVSEPGRRTTVKTRILAHSQQVVRADWEDVRPVAEGIVDEIVGRLEDQGPFQGVILSDYGKGLLTQQALRTFIDWARSARVPVVVDPKNGDFSQYHGVTSLTPNQKEAEQACALQIDEDGGGLPEAGARLLERTGADSVLITRGEHGMALYEKDGNVQHLPTRATKVYDVTGAGDTVIAVYTAALAAGAGFGAAAALANHAAGLAVRVLGTAAITAEELRAALDSGRAS